jgi:hypothetical protein
MKKKDEAEWIKIPVPAIIDQKMFDQASKLRAAYTPLRCAPRRETSPNLLTGLLKCDCCNSTMVAVTSGKGEQYRYYKCSSRISKGNKACKSIAYRMDILDGLILDAFRKKIYTPQYIRDVIDIYRQHMKHAGGEDKVSCYD